MVRWVLVTLFALALVVTPVHAQTGRVLLDMTIQTLPGGESGHCLSVDTGRFVVEARLTGDNRWPVHFSLGPALNVPASLNLRIMSATTTSSSAQIEAGVYCYTLTNEASEPAGDNVTDQTPQL